MKTYHGKRFSPGMASASVHDGEVITPLAPRNDIMNHSPDGFEWGYGGSGPAQLALAILADHRGIPPEPYLYQTFKSKFIAPIQEDEWTITGDEIDLWLASVLGGGQDAVS